MDMRIWLSTPVRTLVVVPAAPAGGRWNLANGATPDHGEHGRPADTRVIFGREFNAQASATRTGRRHLAVVDEACRRQAACWRSAAARSAGSSRRYEPRGTTPKASTPRPRTARTTTGSSSRRMPRGSRRPRSWRPRRRTTCPISTPCSTASPGASSPVASSWSSSGPGSASTRPPPGVLRPAHRRRTRLAAPPPRRLARPPAKPGTPTSAAGPPARACTPVRTSCARWPPDS